MAAKIKLQRCGTKSKPFYRIVIQDERKSPKGKVVEIIGQYNPRVNPALFNVDKETVLAWIKKGAQPTEKLRILLGKAGILPPIDLASLPKRKSKAETPKEEKPAPAEPVKEVKPLDEARGKTEKKEDSSSEALRSPKGEGWAKEEQ